VYHDQKEMRFAKRISFWSWYTLPRKDDAHGSISMAAR